MKKYIREIFLRILIVILNVIEIVLVFFPAKRVSVSNYIQFLEFIIARTKTTIKIKKK